MNELSRFSANLQFGWRRHMPSILQTEAAECGLPSLAMIARLLVAAAVTLGLGVAIVGGAAAAGI